MSKDLHLTIAGVDEAGRLVLTGMFEFWDQYGLRPEIFALKLREIGAVPCIGTFAVRAYLAGWSDNKIVSWAREVWITDPLLNRVGIDNAEARLRRMLTELKDRVAALKLEPRGIREALDRWAESQAQKIEFPITDELQQNQKENSHD